MVALTKNIHLTKILNTKELIRSLIISICFFISVYFNTIYFALLGAAILLLYSIILSSEKVMLILIFLVPNISLITLEARTTSLLGYVFIIIFLKIIVEKRKIKISYITIMSLLFLIMLGIIRFFELNGLYDFLVFTKFSVMSICLIFFFQDVDYRRGINAILFYIYGATQMLIFAILYALKTGTIEKRLLAINNDSNYTALTLVFSVTVILILWIKKQKIPFSFILLILMIVGGLMTGSRLFVISLAFVLSAIILLISTKNVKNKLPILVIMFLLVIIYYAPIEQIQTYIDYLSNKIINPIKGDISSGRFYMWRAYEQIIFNDITNFLFGIGAQDYWIRSSVGLVAHNQIIGSIVTIGVIGTMAVINVQRAIFMTSRNKQKNIKSDMLSYIPLLCIIISYMSLDGLANTNFSVGILLAGFIAHNYQPD